MIGYRKTPLRMPDRGEGIVSITKPRPKSVRFSWFIVLFSLLYAVFVVPRRYVICFLLLFVLHQQTNQILKVYSNAIYTVFQKNPCDYVFDDNLNSKRPIVIIFGTVIT